MRSMCGADAGCLAIDYKSLWKDSATTLRLSALGFFGSAGYLLGYGYCLPPYGTAYRSALRTTRTRTTTRTLRLSVAGFLGTIFCTASSAWVNGMSVEC